MSVMVTSYDAFAYDDDMRIMHIAIANQRSAGIILGERDGQSNKTMLCSRSGVQLNTTAPVEQRGGAVLVPVLPEGQLAVALQIHKHVHRAWISTLIEPFRTL